MSVTILSPSAVSDRLARRPWAVLLPVVLGIALYSVSYVLRYAPEMLPKGAMLPAIMTIMWGPMACVLILALGWALLGPLASWLVPGWRESGRGLGGTVGRMGLRFLVVLLLGGLAAGLVAAADSDTRFFFVVWGIPATVAVGVVALLVVYHSAPVLRYGLPLLLALGAAAPWELIRVEGVTGDFGMDPSWRWSASAEDQVRQFLASEDRGGVETVAPLPQRASVGDWPEFRGAGRDGHGPALKELQEVWRRPVGPGWGSVSGVGERLFTQEQRGEEEVVACYDRKTGKPLWTHAEQARHQDGPSGPGPRATPTFHEGMVYALGGTGVLVALDAATGKSQWRVDIKEELDVKQPVFGYACSPLVLGGKVYVHPGVKGPILAAFDAASGKKLWQVGEQEAESYGSPQRATLDGVEQILVFGAEGLTGHDPETGKEWWRHEWKADPTAQPCVQPTVLPGYRLVIGGAQPGTGIRCVGVRRKGTTWTAALEWETTKVSPRFNDVVHHGGHLYGLDSGRLFCLDAGNGELRWKTRSAPYGSGQVLLAGGKLVVVAERGTVFLLDAVPEKAPAAQRLEALKDKTWNHPAVVQGHLVVRNGKEMVCFGPKE